MSQVCMPFEFRHRLREAGNGLIWAYRGYLRACLISDLLRRATEVQTDDRFGRGHCFEAYPTAGIVEARVYQNVSGFQPLECVAARKRSPEAHLAFASQFSDPCRH